MHCALCGSRVLTRCIVDGVRSYIRLLFVGCFALGDVCTYSITQTPACAICPTLFGGRKHTCRYKTLLLFDLIMMAL